PMQPHRWYVRLNEPPIIESTPLAEVRGKDIDPHLPRGPEAMRWRGFLNEAQMLLHQHSVNEAREERGALPINSVWLWGEGSSAPPPTRPFQRVRGRSALAAGLALASGASAQARPEHASEWFKNTSAEGVELIVLDDLLAPACYGDLHAWQSRLQQLERHWFAPALAALRDGRIGMLSIHSMGAGASFSVETTRQDLRYFWRRPKALNTYADPA
ncbi:MAG TPA: regulator, partial [Burkholderiales bacterium]|nr:regulator [Burkholderiales bacterium]